VIELRVEPGLEAARALLRVKQLAWEHQGAHELHIVAAKPEGGELRVGLGPEWRYSGTPACLSALAEFGEVALR
jgi:hypothetical protein